MEKMGKKQEQSPVERRGRKPVFAEVVLSDANSNSVGKCNSIELLYPNRVRILLPQELLDAAELMCYVYASTFPHCNMKSTEYLWPKTKRLVKDERRIKSNLCVCA